MSTHHRNNPLPQYWSPPSHQWGTRPSLLIITGQQTSGFCRGVRGAAATLMTINWLVFARQGGGDCRVLAGFIMFNAPPLSPAQTGVVSRQPSSASGLAALCSSQVSQSGTLSGFYVGSMIIADNNPTFGPVHVGCDKSDNEWRVCPV